MKNFIKIILVLIITLLWLNNANALDWNCPSGVKKLWNQDFCWVIRLGTSRIFEDFASNTWGDKIIVKPDIWFLPDTYYDGGSKSSFPSFRSSSWLKSNWYILPAWAKNKKIIESYPWYKILKRPASWERSYNNIIIKYKVNYYNYNKATKKAYWSKKSHLEVAHYAISWCGDKIVDTEYWEQCEPWVWDTYCSNSCKLIDPALLCGNGVKDTKEQCDPSDTKHIWWGNKGCSEICKTLTGPSCDQQFNYKLRQGRWYTFWDYMFNKTDTDIKIKQVTNKNVYKSEQGDYNKSSSWPYFNKTSLNIVKKW